MSLVTPFDSEGTHVNAPSPAVDLPPTVAYNAPPPSPSPPSPVSEPQRQRGLRPWVLGALAVGVLLIGLLIGVWMSQRPNASSSNQAAATPTPARATPTKPTPTPTPTPALVTATPTPGPLATASPRNVESEPECMLYNDRADRSGVKVRMNCDTKDCESDDSTIVGEYPDRTRVQVIKGSNVKGKRFTWVKVIIVEEKRAVWVASAKIKC
ncbi:MAG TPA: hypothetical protein VGC89_14530 [Pyrinomonadaceae bacterium]